MLLSSFPSSLMRLVAGEGRQAARNILHVPRINFEKGHHHPTWKQGTSQSGTNPQSLAQTIIKYIMWNNRAEKGRAISQESSKGKFKPFDRQVGEEGWAEVGQVKPVGLSVTCPCESTSRCCIKLEHLPAWLWGCLNPCNKWVCLAETLSKRQERGSPIPILMLSRQERFKTWGSRVQGQALHDAGWDKTGI